jgi:hypothetical protein
VTPELNNDALPGYLHLGYVVAPHSLFKGIRKLPPATIVTIEDGRIDEHRYWRVSGVIDESRGVDEWVGIVRERLEESVRMQMVSDVPIGAFLSGRHRFERGRWHDGETQPRTRQGRIRSASAGAALTITTTSCPTPRSLRAVSRPIITRSSLSRTW